MRKCLLLALLLLSFAPSGLRAQTSLFDIETDTVCVGQEVRIFPHAMNATSYYWGFCSGYLENLPLMDNLGSTFEFDNPSGMEVAKDGDNYYGFVVNRGSGDLIRLNYGKTLSSIPTITNFGNLDSSVCPFPNSVYMLKDSGKWHLFICGGTNAANSTISRIDFGKKLSNVPNGVRMGNPGGLLNNPRGIFVSQQGPLYYGFVVNMGGNPSRLVRLNFGNNASRTPTANNVTISGGGFGGGPSFLDTPTDIGPIYEEGNWYFLIPNAGLVNGGGMSAIGPSISRLFFGSSLSNSPVGSFVTPATQTGPLDKPSAISLVKDCGGYYAYITNQGKNEVLRYNLPTLTATNVSPVIPTYDPTGIFVEPSDITRVIRDRDSLYMFVLDESTHELSRMTFPQCHNTNIQSSDLPKPPNVKYDTSGLFNIYLAINEGQPNMAVDCKQVRVIQVPPITLTPDTLICQGDTLHLVVASQYALDYYFSPDYNLSAPAGINVYVYPRRKFTYNIQIPFADGCVVDTTITVDVSRVLADAGPDREIFDGASTVVGGPNTYKGPEYTFEWFPTQFMDNPFKLTPTVNPPTDLTYYLRVTNINGCSSIDTVNVKVSCGDLNLPNAFEPENLRGAPTRFGVMNKQIVQLNYFRIFDRWGREVFSTTDVTKQWDGTVGGEPAPLAVYVWEADGFCEAGQRVFKSGNVTLIR